MNQILLTGFEAFAGEKINPSQILVESQAQKASIKKLILPVSYEKCFTLVKKELSQGEVKAVLMLGQAGGRTKVGMERFYVNLIDADIPDADGFLVKEEKISRTGPVAYKCQLPLHEWKLKAHELGLPIEISNSAGTYVCNFLAYSVAREFTESGILSLFVHFPFLPEQVEAKTGVIPTMPMAQMKSCLDFILEQLEEFVQ